MKTSYMYKVHVKRKEIIVLRYVIITVESIYYIFVNIYIYIYYI